MGKYRTLGTLFNRVFRNDLNKNFEDIDKDIQTQKKRVDDLIKKAPQPSEVVDARGEHPVLRDRLDSVDAQLAQTVTQIGWFLDVKKYAVGDDATDDTENIQQALQYAYDNGIKNIVISGNFLVNGSLSPFIGQTIHIEGRIKTTNINNIIFSIEQDDVTIQGSGLLQGPGKTSGASSGVVSVAKNTKVQGIKATGFSNVGIGTGFGAIGAEFRYNECFENKTGISLYRSKDCKVYRNRCYKNGIGVNGGGIVVTGIENGEVQNFDISNNQTNENYASGISVFNGTRGTISDNISNDNGSGILGQGSGIALLLNPAGLWLADITITANIVNRNTDHGIVVQNNKDHTLVITGISITGNTASNNFKCGIRLVNGVDASTLTANTCNSNGSAPSAAGFRHGIMIADRSTRNVLSNNTCLSNAEDGIRITDESTDFEDTGSGENVLDTNICRLNGGYGINIHKKTVESVANRLIGNSLRGNTLGEINDAGTNTEKTGNRFSFDKIQGTATLVAGQATISTTEVKTGDRILLSVITSGGTQGSLFISNIVNGTSFTVKSTSTTDTSTFSWKIDH